MKRNKNREDSREHDTTDDKEYIEEQVILKVIQHYRNKDCIIVFRDHIIKGQDQENPRVR